MDVFSDPGELTAYVWRVKRNHTLKLWEESRAKPAYAPLVGLVPTMGALHEGHLSLVKRSVAENPLNIVSIFVNPLQFGEGEDLESYPGDFEKDSQLLDDAGVDVVFYPDAPAFYPADFSTKVSVSDVAERYCGAERPGHFDGVATVVAKLFNVAVPDVAYFGEKDYQQLVMIKRMVRDLNLPVRIVGCPTVREDDGLAMSSRNMYLSSEERSSASGFYEGLSRLAGAFENGEDDVNGLVQLGMARMMERMGLISGFKIEYLEIADPETLSIRELRAEPGDVALSAVWLGGTRLIDNVRLGNKHTRE